MLMQNCWKQLLGIMYIFKNQVSMFGYFKIPDVILTLASSQKLNWTRSFDTHCIQLIQKRLSFGNLKFKLQNTRESMHVTHTSGLLTTSP